jgi:WD40 repeat protein
MIWQYAHGYFFFSSSLFARQIYNVLNENRSGYNNIENWKCGHTLRAHNGDVLDLAWSTNDEFLATCSIDNTIIIWNALKFPEIVQRINAHAGLVKGVTWDPAGQFIASQVGCFTSVSPFYTKKNARAPSVSSPMIRH